MNNLVTNIILSGVILKFVFITLAKKFILVLIRNILSNQQVHWAYQLSRMTSRLIDDVYHHHCDLGDYSLNILNTQEFYYNFFKQLLCMIQNIC